MKLTLGQVLSITTAKVLCSEEELFPALFNLLGQPFPMAIMPYVANSARTHILKLHPQFETVVPPWGRGEGAVWPDWLEQQTAIYGDVFEVEPLPEDVVRDIMGIVPGENESGVLWMTAQGVVRKG